MFKDAAGDGFEIHNAAKSFSIESKNILTHKGNGRVVAVFYNDYDINQLFGSGVKDVDGEEIHLGDTIVFNYVTPMGRQTDQPDNDETYKVIFKHGAFGFEGSTRFTPLVDRINTTEGEYVSNKGNKIKYSDYIHAKIKEDKNG